MPTLHAISWQEAAQRLQGLEYLDPRGLATAADIAPMCQAATHCFRVADAVGDAVIVVHLQNRVAWIEAAAGGGGDNLCRAIDAVVGALDADAIAFQTARPGLVRRAKQLGYSVAGHIMRRDL